MIPPDTESGFDDPTTSEPATVIDMNAGEVVFTRLPAHTRAAHRWHKNGDHPDDYRAPHIALDANGEVITFSTQQQKAEDWEGQIVRRFRHPSFSSSGRCPCCREDLLDHGWIDEGGEGHTVCPGDWILALSDGRHLPCKNDLFQIISTDLTNGG